MNKLPVQYRSYRSTSDDCLRQRLKELVEQYPCYGFNIARPFEGRKIGSELQAHVSDLL